MAITNQPAVPPAVASAAAPTHVEGANILLSTDLSGALRTSSSGGGGGAATIADGANVVEGTTTDAAVITDANGTISGKLRGLVKIFTDLWDSTNHKLYVWATLRNAAGTEVGTLAAPVRNQGVGTQDVNIVSGPLAAGSAVVGKVGIDQTTPGTTNLVAAGQNGTWTVQPGNTANTTPWLVSAQAAIAGGLSVYSFLSTAAVQAANIKNAAGQVYALHFFNNTATIAYVRLYNQTASPGTGDTVFYRALIPASTSGTGFVVALPPGIAFSTGIGIRVTAAAADNDATVLAANAIVGNVLYK